MTSQLRSLASRICQRAPLALSLAAGMLTTWAASAQTTPVPAALALPDSPQAWSRAATQAVEEAYRLTLENHPGPVDPHNPGFAKQLEASRTQALSLATQVKDAAGFRAALGRFTVGLQDGHAGVYDALPDESIHHRWPGFVTAWRGKGLFVHRSEVPSVPVGAQVLGCDGHSMDALIRRRVFDFRSQASLPSAWWDQALNVFLDEGNPFAPAIRRCELRLAGKTRSVQLEWRDWPEDGWRWRGESRYGARLPVGLQWLDGELAWIALRDFQPDAADVQRYEEMFRALAADRPRLLKARGIVLDLRRNQGGSSTWSARVAAALWGDAVFKRGDEALFAPMQTWWRASPATLQSLRDAPARLEKAGIPELIPKVLALSEDMQQALERSEPLFREAKAVDADAAKGSAAERLQRALQARSGDEPALTVPVWVIVSPGCASACLDALDYFTMFPNTRLIGAPSGADSTYMDVRLQQISSGLARVVLPGKVLVNRPRGNGEYYVPDVLHEALDWSQAGLEQHIRRLLEKPAPAAWRRSY